MIVFYVNILWKIHPYYFVFASFRTHMMSHILAWGILFALLKFNCDDKVVYMHLIEWNGMWQNFRNDDYVVCI